MKCTVERISRACALSWVFITILLACGTSAHALEKVTLQLKWTHAFQFAGYYAAREKGYYREAGLEVDIAEATPETDPVRNVLDGKAQYGVGTSSLILERKAGRPVVVLAVIFQQSPYEIYASPTIRTLKDLIGKRLMMEPQSDELLAYLKKEGIAPEQVTIVPHSFNSEGLIQGKAEAISGYISNEPYYFKQARYPYQTFSPRSAGIDFYGDNLFTSEAELHGHPARARAFRAATMRGWQYAKEHRDEIIELIMAKYSRQHTREYLHYESDQMIPLLQPNLIEIGYMNPGRWRHIADTYAGIGLMPANYPLGGFLYQPDEHDLTWFYRTLGIALTVIIGLGSLAFYVFRANRRLSLLMEENARTGEILAESEELWRTIIKTSPDGIAISSMDGTILQISDRMVAMLGGASADDVTGRNIFEFIDPVYHDKATSRISSLLNGNYSGVADYLMIRRDGSTFYAEANAGILRDSHGKPRGIIYIERDITERKQTEQELQEALAMAQRFKAALDQVPSLIYMKDRDSRYIYANQASLKLLGSPPEALIGSDDTQHFLPEVAEKRRNVDQRVFDGEQTSEEVEFVSGTGERKLYLEVKTPIYDDHTSGAVSGLLGISTDITDSRRAEEERFAIEKRLLQVQKLESLGVLAGGIAHDFNNIMTAIIGNAELTLMKLSPESQAAYSLRMIEQSAERASKLANQMLAYAGKGRYFTDRLNLNRLLTEMRGEITESVSPGIDLFFNLPEELPPVMADSSQMHQIIIGLLSNASEAIDNGHGVISINTGTGQYSTEDLSGYITGDEIKPGPFVFLRIDDSGCGMDSDTLSRLFDPFFTTKFTGRGLGMAAVMGIVRSHKGGIKVTSKPGDGTSVRIILPVSSGPALQPPSEQRDRGGSGTVLLVDDEESVRTIGSDMLKELGYAVITAHDGLEAIRAFRMNQDISCVILDLTMPHMDGEQCFEELRQIRPDVKIIISSGFNEDEVTGKFEGRGMAGFIQKPYRLSTLRDAITGTRS